MDSDPTSRLETEDGWLVVYYDALEPEWAARALLEAGPTLHVALQGSVDSYTARGFKDLLQDQFDSRPDITELEADFREVDFVDLTTLGILAAAAKRLNRKSDQRPSVTIQARNGDIPELMRVTGLDRIFRIIVEEES